LPETLVARDGETQRAREGFEHRFDLMMRGTPVERTQVHVGAGGLREALKRNLRQGRPGSRRRASLRFFAFTNTKGAPTKIDGGSARVSSIGIRKYPARRMPRFETESLLHGFAEGDSDVFDGVMLVHVEITASLHLQIECAVTSDEFEHVVEEANACRDAGISTAIEIQLR